MDNIYATPGPRPYQVEECDLLWGRDNFITQISRYLDHERLVILTSPSGTGKTSLIQAGLLPQLKSLRDWHQETQLIQIRFTTYDKSKPIDPISIFEMSMLGAQKAYPNLPIEESCTWLVLKAYLEQNFGTNSGQRVVLIFDQFEELFTYPDACVKEFLAEIGDLYDGQIPLSVSKAIKRKRLLHPQECGHEFEQTVDWLNQDLSIHLLLSIEGDALYQLERLLDYIPEALSRTHELPPLHFSDVANLLPPQLIEQASELAWKESWETHNTACSNLRLQLWIQENEQTEAIPSAPDLPSLSSYYQGFIEGLNTEADRIQALELLEDHLLNLDKSQRSYISEKELITLFPNALWEHMLEKGIVTAFTHYRDGKSYEISHHCWRKVIADHYEARILAANRRTWLQKAGAIAAVATILLASLSWLAGKNNWPEGGGPLKDTLILKETIYVSVPDGNRRSDTLVNPIYIIDTLTIRDTIYPVGPCPPPICTNCDSLEDLILQLKIKINELQVQLPCPDENTKDRGIADPKEPFVLEVIHPVTREIQKVTFNSVTYTVKGGESLWDIARKLVPHSGENTEHEIKIMVQKLKKINNLTSDEIKKDQTLYLPPY